MNQNLIKQKKKNTKIKTKIDADIRITYKRVTLTSLLFLCFTQFHYPFLHTECLISFRSKQKFSSNLNLRNLHSQLVPLVVAGLPVTDGRVNETFRGECRQHDLPLTYRVSNLPMFRYFYRYELCPTDIPKFNDFSTIRISDFL